MVVRIAPELLLQRHVPCPGVALAYRTIGAREVEREIQGVGVAAMLRFGY